MSNTPLISIIVPFYNVESYLNECLNSILMQTYSNFEVLLINDGSLDNSLNIANNYCNKDKRFFVYTNTNSGISFSRNFGIANSKGEYITFIDSDDYVEPKYLELLLESCINNNTQISFCAHNILISDKKIIRYGQVQDGIFNKKNTFNNILLDKGMDLSPWGKIYKKQLFNDIKYPESHLFEDTATTYKLIDKVDNISFISTPLYFYRKRYNSITTTGNFSKKMDLVHFTTQMCTYINQEFPDLNLSCNRRLVWAYFSTLNQLIKTEDYKDYINEKKQLISFLKEHKKEILTSNCYSKRDKIAILCLSLGFSFYKNSWQIYLWITGRINI